jgi:DinB superfamily
MNTVECSPREYLLELDRQTAQARSLMAGVSRASLNWRPNDGSWSMAQCLEHLSATNRIYLEAMRAGIRRNPRGARHGPRNFRAGGWLTGRFISSMEPPPKRKFRAFRNIQPAPIEHDGEAVLSGFITEQEKLATFIGDTHDGDMGCVWFWNPFLKGIRFTVSSGLLLIGAHNRRHLWQAERVKASESFPS